ncbi:hypothetical protein BHE74_00036493, partial [Ensete ventricosum]
MIDMRTISTGTISPYVVIQYSDLEHKSRTAHGRHNSLQIHVGEVIALGTENGIAELPPTKYRVVLEDKRYHGAIRVGVRFRTK